MTIEYQEHNCTSLPESGVSIAFDLESFPREHGSWFLYINRQATEEDLEENHHLEDIEDSLWSMLLEITHCPYCGANLYEHSKPDSDIGEFRLLDSSEYSLKVR